MTNAQTELSRRDIADAITELRTLILAQYPDAQFEVFYRDDPEGVRLRVTVDVDDTDVLVDSLLDKLYEIQVERELPLYVIPVQPEARVAAQLRAQQSRRSAGVVLPPSGRQ